MNRISRQRLKSLLVYVPTTGRWRRPRGYKRRRGQRLKVGTKRKDGRNQIQIDGRLYVASVLAWFYMTGKWPLRIIDHKDRNPSNDRWQNLRHGTQGQNAMNCSIRSNNTSGFTGIRKRNGGFQAILAQRSLGTFSSVEKAVKARRQEAKRIYGEFAT